MIRQQQNSMRTKNLPTLLKREQDSKPEKKPGKKQAKAMEHRKKEKQTTRN